MHRIQNAGTIIIKQYAPRRHAERQQREEHATPQMIPWYKLDLYPGGNAPYRVSLS